MASSINRKCQDNQTPKGTKMSKTVMEIRFPAELQFATAASKDDDAKVDNLDLRLVALGSDTYELTILSESDVFLNFYSKIDRSVFDVMRREQQLVVNFEGFPSSLSKLLQGCIRDRTTQAALLLIENEVASLHIVCKMEHKIVELLSCPFSRLNEAETRIAVQQRFLELKQRLEKAEAKLSEISSTYRTGRTPSLLNRNSHKSSW